MKFKDRLDELRKFFEAHKGRSTSGWGITYTEPLTIFQRDIAFFKAHQREQLVDAPQHAHRYVKFPMMIAVRPKEGNFHFISQVCYVCGKEK